MLLSSMLTLSNAKHSIDALNLESWFAEMVADEEAPEAPSETDAEKIERLEAQVTKLKSDLARSQTDFHEAERAAKDARKALEDAKKDASRDRRELADLRELVFLDGVEEDATPDTVDETQYPFTAERTILVFGGHDSWLKEIKPRFRGDIRFLGKDLLFDTAIIRNADIIWIQTNAMKHKQYYRIIDAARQFKKPVRYFTCASAAKCAQQIVDAEK